MLGFVWLLTLWAPGERHFGRAAALFGAGFLGLTLLIPAPLTALIISASLVQMTGVGIGLAALLRASMREKVQPRPPSSAGSVRL
jgi:hypothetical protein